MNLVECTGCGTHERFTDTPDGWIYVLPDGSSKARTHVGTCPACQHRAKQAVKVGGGVNFNPAELEAGTYKDRQKNLFGDE